MSELHAIPGEPTLPERRVDERTMAAILGVDERTLRRWRVELGIPSVTYGRRVRRYVASVVIAHLARREIRAEEVKENAA